MAGSHLSAVAFPCDSCTDLFSIFRRQLLCFFSPPGPELPVQLRTNLLSTPKRISRPMPRLLSYALAISAASTPPPGYTLYIILHSPSADPKDTSCEGPAKFSDLMHFLFHTCVSTSTRLLLGHLPGLSPYFGPKPFFYSKSFLYFPSSLFESTTLHTPF